MPHTAPICRITRGKAGKYSFGLLRHLFFPALSTNFIQIWLMRISPCARYENSLLQREVNEIARYAIPSYRLLHARIMNQIREFINLARGTRYGITR